jgi:hypothetical protein
LASGDLPWRFFPASCGSLAANRTVMVRRNNMASYIAGIAAQQVIEKPCEYAWLPFALNGELVIGRIRVNLPRCPPANSTKP